MDRDPQSRDEKALRDDTRHLSRWPQRVIAGAGVLIGAIAIMALVGWWLRSVVMTSLTPSFPAMQINTAIALLASGCGLWGFSQRRAKVVAVAALVVGSIGLATLIEHAFEIDLGIDTLFGEPFFKQGVMRPGRMAPVTALCLTLIASALLTMVRIPLVGWRAVYTGMIGTLTATFGVFSIAGLPLGLGDTYGWGNLIRLAPLTAFCFLILGGCLASWVLLRHYSDRLPLAEARRSIIGYSVIGTGVVALFSAALVAVPLYVTLQSNERTTLLRLAQARATLCATYLAHVQDLGRHLSAITPDGSLAQVLNSNDDLAGLSRLRADGTVVATIGRVLSAEQLAVTRGKPISDPLLIDGVVVVAVTSPVIAMTANAMTGDRDAQSLDLAQNPSDFLFQACYRPRVPTIAVENEPKTPSFDQAWPSYEVDLIRGFWAQARTE